MGRRIADIRSVDAGDAVSHAAVPAPQYQVGHPADPAFDSTLPAAFNVDDAAQPSTALGDSSMRLTEPRLPPLSDAEMTPQQDAVIAPFRKSGRDYNIFRTFVRDPAALKAFLVWGGHVLSNDNPLGARRREIAILRTGYLCKAGYEWARHVPIARHAGLSDTEIAAIKEGTGDATWDEADRTLLAATDALVRNHFIDDAGWLALCGHFSEVQRLALIFTVGQYTMVSMFLNSVGVQLDDDVTLDADLAGWA